MKTPPSLESGLKQSQAGSFFRWLAEQALLARHSHKQPSKQYQWLIVTVMATVSRQNHKGCMETRYHEEEQRNRPTDPSNTGCINTGYINLIPRLEK